MMVYVYMLLYNCMDVQIEFISSFLELFYFDYCLVLVILQTLYDVLFCCYLQGICGGVEYILLLYYLMCTLECVFENSFSKFNYNLVISES